MTSPTYILTDDFKEVVDEKGNRFPARGFTEKHLGVDLEKGKHFKLEKMYVDADGNQATVYTVGYQLVAVAVPATEETI